jgi:hypothetical protein
MKEAPWRNGPPWGKRRMGAGNTPNGSRRASPALYRKGMTWLNASFESLAGYPRWLVLSCAFVFALGVLWFFAKLLKWSLYLLVLLVIIGGGGVVVLLLT